MTTSDVVAAVVLCKCGHAESRHTDEEGCGNSECGCSEFRKSDVPVTPPTPVVRSASANVVGYVRPAGAPAQTGPTIEQILAAGKRSDYQRTAQMAERIERDISALRHRIFEERRNAEAKRRETEAKDRLRREVAQLEAELQAKRAALRGDRTPPRTKNDATGSVSCPVENCDRTFNSQQGLTMHKRRAHDGWGHVGRPPRE